MEDGIQLSSFDRLYLNFVCLSLIYAVSGSRLHPVRRRKRCGVAASTTARWRVEAEQEAEEEGEGAQEMEVSFGPLPRLLYRGARRRTAASEASAASTTSAGRPTGARERSSETAALPK